MYIVSRWWLILFCSSKDLIISSKELYLVLLHNTISVIHFYFVNLVVISTFQLMIPFSLPLYAFSCETESTVSSSSRAIDQLPSCFTIDQSWNFPKGFLRLVVTCFLFLFLPLFFGNLSLVPIVLFESTPPSSRVTSSRKKHRYRSQWFANNQESCWQIMIG